MTVMVIDTLQFSKRMQNAGLSQKISEELAGAIKDSTTISTENLATKQDLQAVKQDLHEVKNDVEIINKDIKAVEKNLSFKIESVEERLSAKIESVEERLNLKIEMVKKDTIIAIAKTMSVLITISTAIIGTLITLHH
jgi:hypothetical protein